MAREATVRLNVEVGDGRANVERLEGSLEELEVAAVEAGGSFDRIGSSAVESAQQVERASEQAEAALRSQATATSRVRGSTRSFGNTAQSTAAQLSTDLTQSAQDAAFGIENLAASAPFLTEQFQRLQRQSGGTTGALSALFSALKGPTGVIAGFTLLLTFKDQIISFFTETGDAADEAGDRFQEAADSLINIDEQLEVSDLTIERGERMRQSLEQRLQSTREAVSALELLQRRVTGPEVEAGVPLEQMGGVLDALQDTGLTLQQIEEQGASIVEERLQARREELDPLEQALSRTEDQLSQARAMQRVYEQLPDDVKETAEESEEAADAIRDSVENVFQLSRNLEQVRGYMRRQQQGTPASEGIGSNYGLQSGAQVGMGAMQVGAAIGQGRANRQALQQSVESARSLLVEFEMLKPEIKTLNDLLGDSEEQSEDTFDATQLGAQAATAAMSNFGSAIAQSESALDALQQTASQVLSTIGGTFLTQAIRGGSIAGLSGTGLGAAGVGAGLLGGLVDSFQHGGTSRGGAAVVHGPELVDLPRGAQVHNARETTDLAAKLDETNKRLGRVEGAVGEMKIAVPARGMRDAIVEADLRDGQENGSVVVANVNEI